MFDATSARLILLMLVCYLPSSIYGQEVNPGIKKIAIVGVVEVLTDDDNNGEIIGVSIWDDKNQHDYLVAEDSKEVELRKFIDKMVTATGYVTVHDSKKFSMLKLESFEELRSEQASPVIVEQSK